MQTLAAIVRATKQPFEIATIDLDEPRPDEVQVRVIAAGVRHTDAIVRDQIYPTFLPAVFGHEGAGVVVAVGSAVTSVKPDDKVVLGFNSCGQCLKCLGGKPAYCEKFYDRNFACTRDAGHTTLFTRATKEQAEAIIDTLDDVFYDADAGFLAYPATPPEASGVSVLVVAAGTSDLPHAKEALHTASYLGRSTSLIVDVGVAGIHRLLSYEEELRAAGVLIVAAGMDGALPGVVAGLVSAPVVALPTSVGYGAGAGGIAPLLTMLNACAPGVGVVNIDNGYGAGHLAAQIAAR